MYRFKGIDFNLYYCVVFIIVWSQNWIKNKWWLIAQPPGDFSPFLTNGSTWEHQIRSGWFSFTTCSQYFTFISVCHTLKLLLVQPPRLNPWLVSLTWSQLCGMSSVHTASCCACLDHMQLFTWTVFSRRERASSPGLPRLLLHKDFCPLGERASWSSPSGCKGTATVAVRQSHECVTFPRLACTQENSQKLPGKGQHAQNIRSELK